MGFAVQIKEGWCFFSDSRSFLESLNHSGSTEGGLLRAEVTPGPRQSSFGSMCSVSSERSVPPTDRYILPPTDLETFAQKFVGAFKTLLSPAVPPPLCGMTGFQTPSRLLFFLSAPLMPAALPGGPSEA